METHAHLVFLLAALTHDTHGRSSEGVLGRGNIWEEGKRETPSSEVRRGVLTPWEPESRSPERRKRSLDRQDQNHEYDLQDQEPVIGEPAEDTTSLNISLKAPLPALPPAPASAPPPIPAPLSVPDPPVTSYSSPGFSVTRLLPVFVSSEVARAPESMGQGLAADGRYLPPGVRFTLAAPDFSFLPCPKTCETRNTNGDCEIDATCLFGRKPRVLGE
ncbi:uncharacterized protein [Penaeus vannamei]|uniref:uncharacterized protein isoform X1 n=1 Tax=Penaeus vannamei TaxID=6689 RepID=UPI00387F6FB4